MEAEHVSREEGLVAELERVKASSLATTQELQARTRQVEELRKQVDTCKAELEMLVMVWGGGFCRSGGKSTSFGI